MKFPRLKNALLCRILVYIVVLGGFIAPIIVTLNLGFLPEAVKMLVCLIFAIGLVAFLIKNFVLLMAIDIELAMLHCRNTARKRFALTRSFSVEKTEKRISRFGKSCEAIATSPRPTMLQYKSSFPISVYSSGIEKVITTFRTDYLDKNGYLYIVNSAIANSKALKGKKTHRFIGKSQKESPLNRVTVIVILAKRIDEKFRNSMFDTVCKNGGDGLDVSVLPCVVDLDTRFCTFDSLRIPYMGFQYPVKNRGIRIIRKYLFKNRFPFADSPDMLDTVNDLNTDQSLWSFWRTSKKELILDEKQKKKRFDKMTDKGVFLDDGYLYLKWENRGIWLSVELNEELKKAEIDGIEFWDYPKRNKIAKATVKEMKCLIDAYFAQKGYTTDYIPID